MRFLFNNRASIFFLSIGVLFFLGSFYFIISRNADMKHFQTIIQKEIKSKPGTGKFVEELNAWIYLNKGFAQNSSYYLLPQFGPTARQILAKGGDCSDKSRLLSTMLESVGMDSTLVMLYGCDTCGSNHTIVEAFYEGGRMVADPVYDIVFPRNNEQYSGIKELRSDPDILINRLDYLKTKRGNTDKIAFYQRDIETYSWPKTVNWDKNSITQGVGSFIAQFTDDPFLVMRPHFLEDPKLFYIYFLSFAGLAIVMLSILISYFVSIRYKTGQNKK